MYRREGDQITLTMSSEDYYRLQMMLSAAFSSARRNPILFRAWLEAGNRINQGNPDWTPYTPDNPHWTPYEPPETA
jgi:hypothetical protein